MKRLKGMGPERAISSRRKTPAGVSGVTARIVRCCSVTPPQTVRVKISSEAADTIALSPVVVREMTRAELVAIIVASAGKDVVRVREILQRGSLVSGASRFRWDSFIVDEASVHELLSAFPSPDPTRPFSAASCVSIVMRGGTERVEIDRVAAESRRWFRRRTLWEEILALAGTPAYTGYSYKVSADVYSAALNASGQERLRTAARLSPYSAIAARIEAAALDTIEFFVKRESSVER
jgi:hypothetical protein